MVFSVAKNSHREGGGVNKATLEIKCALYSTQNSRC
jgi:hypothetical protein